MKFFNSIQKNMSFADVIASIKFFIKSNPDSKYQLTVGTDSDITEKCTCFSTGIHIHRIGRESWCCASKRTENKWYKNLREKTLREIAITNEIVYMLNEQLIDSLYEFTLKCKNFDCKIKAQVDTGAGGETKMLIRKMVGDFEGVCADPI